MPIYEFKCSSCGKEFEEMTGFNEASPLCPSCGGETQKLMSACQRLRKDGNDSYSSYGSGGGCAGCSGGNCGSCGR